MASETQKAGWDLLPDSDRERAAAILAACPQLGSVEAALAFSTRLLMAYRLPEADARTVAHCLVRADLRGVDTHGIQYLPHYLGRVEKGLINPTPKLKMEQATAYFKNSSVEIMPKKEALLLGRELVPAFEAGCRDDDAPRQARRHFDADGG